MEARSDNLERAIVLSGRRGRRAEVEGKNEVGGVRRKKIELYKQDVVRTG